MVCMIFIVHTISGTQHRLKMCCPDAYSDPIRKTGARVNFHRLKWRGISKLVQ